MVLKRGQNVSRLMYTGFSRFWSNAARSCETWWGCATETALEQVRAGHGCAGELGAAGGWCGTVGGVQLSGVRKAQVGAHARGSESAAWVASKQSGAVEELRRRGYAWLVGQQGRRASR
jgi:hypothetical protein